MADYVTALLAFVRAEFCAGGGVGGGGEQFLSLLKNYFLWFHCI